MCNPYAKIHWSDEINLDYSLQYPVWYFQENIFQNACRKLIIITKDPRVYRWSKYNFGTSNILYRLRVIIIYCCANQWQLR